MRRLVSWLVMIPLALVVVAFSVANRDPVVISLWPAPFTIEAPLALILLSAVAAGTVAGFFLALLSGGRARYRAKVQARSKEKANIQQALAERDHQPAAAAPAAAPAEFQPPAISTATVLPPPPQSSGSQRPPVSGA